MEVVVPRARQHVTEELGFDSVVGGYLMVFVPRALCRGVLD